MFVSPVINKVLVYFQFEQQIMHWIWSFFSIWSISGNHWCFKPNLEQHNWRRTPRSIWKNLSLYMYMYVYIYTYICIYYLYIYICIYTIFIYLQRETGRKTDRYIDVVDRYFLSRKGKMIVTMKFSIFELV